MFFKKNSIIQAFIDSLKSELTIYGKHYWLCELILKESMYLYKLLLRRKYLYVVQEILRIKIRLNCESKWDSKRKPDSIRG